MQRHAGTREVLQKHAEVLNYYNSLTNNVTKQPCDSDQLETYHSCGALPTALLPQSRTVEIIATRLVQTIDSIIALCEAQHYHDFEFLYSFLTSSTWPEKHYSDRVLYVKNDNASTHKSQGKCTGTAPQITKY